MSVRSFGRGKAASYGTVRSVSGRSLRSIHSGRPAGGAASGGGSGARRSQASRGSVSTTQEFARAKTNGQVGEVVRVTKWCNAPGHVRGKGEYHEPSVMKALSSRLHSTGKDYTMITGQKPADSAVITVVYETEDPNTDVLALRGGSGEPVIVDADGVADIPEPGDPSNEKGSCAKLGICEGFELASITYLGEAQDESLQGRRVTIDVKDEKTLAQIMELLTEDLRFKERVPPGPLGGADGISALDTVCPTGPMLGVKTREQMRGLNLPVQLQVRRGFQSLPAAEVQNKLVLQMDDEGKPIAMRLGFVSPLSGAIAFSGRQCSRRFGMPMIKQKHCLQFVDELQAALQNNQDGMCRNDAPTAVFEGCVRRSGLLWLSKEEKQVLCAMVDSRRWKEEGEMEDAAWQERVSDLLVFGRIPESVQVGGPAEYGKPAPLKKLSPDAFMNVAAPIQRQHIKQITQILERRQQEKMTEEGITEKDFRQAVFMAGITWLTRDQVKVLFQALDAGGDGGVSMTEWQKQFRWDPAEAAAEVERVLEVYWDELKAQNKAFPEKELDFEEFCDLLFEAGCTWLTTEQNKILFDSIDEDKSGKVSPEEFRNIGKLRMELEAKWEESIENKP